MAAYALTQPGNASAITKMITKVKTALRNLVPQPAFSPSFA